MQLWIVVAAASLLVVLINGQFDPSEFETCDTTGELPQKPRSLSFCHKFNDKACCHPTNDNEDGQIFDAMYNLGLSCRLRGDVRESPLAKWYCLNCDPQLPSYMRGEPYLPASTYSEDNPPLVLRDIASLNATDDFNYAPDSRLADLYGADMANLTDDQAALVDQLPTINYVTATVLALPLSCPSSYTGSLRYYTALICREWMEKQFNMEGSADFMSVYKACGLQVATGCMDVHGIRIPGRDRYTCGDDPLYPASAFTNFEQFLNNDDMGPPTISDSLAYRVVPNVACTDDYLDSIATNSSTILQVASSIQAYDLMDIDASYNVFNPPCRRTRAQILKYGVSPFSSMFNRTAYVNSNFSFAYLDDVLPASYTGEQCFNSAASVQVAFSLLFSFMALALWWL